MTLRGVGRIRAAAGDARSRFGIAGHARRAAAGRRGLEVGGPSAIFRDLLPVYRCVASLDNVNFASATVWEGTIEAGDTFVYDPRRPPGRQYLAEAGDLAAIADGTYGVVLSSHTLEHTANPLATLAEWRRVLRGDGALVLVLPQKQGTFDHRRPVTTMRHLLEDEARGTTEDDLTHLPEILELHDLERDPPAGTPEEFEARSRDNAANRCLHHHVFDEELAVAAVEHAGFRVRAVDMLPPYHIVVVATSTRPSSGADAEPPAR
jgi:SAM-dependent methyltransferase